MKITRIAAFLFFFLALGCIFLLSSSKADVIKSKYFNYVEKGGRTVKTSPSTQYRLMETYPQSTVTVYEVGTTILATIWTDKDGLFVKANPFIADTDSFFYFYVDCGKYDIKFSGTGITTPYTWGDVAICGSISSGTGNVSTLGGTEDFIPKWNSTTELGDSVLYNPLHVQTSSTTLFGWTSGLATAALDIALGRNAANKLEINNGTLGNLADLTLHRIEPIPTITIPGLNFGPIATDPTNPVAGDCWYNTTSNQFKCFNGTVIVILETGAGIETINTLSAANQFLVTGTSGTDFNINSTTATHTFNIPDASLTARGLVTINTQSFNGDKTFDDNLIISSNIVNSFLYSDTTKAVQTTTAPTNGQLLIGSTGAAPVVANITGDSNISIVNTAGGIQITCAGCSGGGGGTTINPTDTFVPYRLNATTFADSPLTRFDANTMEQRNGTNIQAFKLYRTYTDAVNNAGIMFHHGSGLQSVIENFAIGSGVGSGLNSMSLRADHIEFKTDVGDTGTFITTWDINAFLHDGGLNPGGDLTYDIGSNNTHRVRWILSAQNPTVATGNFDKTTSTALADVPDLTRAIQNTKQYKFEADLFFTADVVGGHKYAINSTGTMTSISYQIISTCNSGPSVVISSFQTTEDGAASEVGCTAGHTRIVGYFKGGNGNLSVRFAQAAATGTSSILTNSTFKVELISH